MAESSLTFMELARIALERAERPLDRRELWKLVEREELDARLETKGKTPWESLAAKLYVEIRDNPEGAFMGVGRRPMRFWLRSRPLPSGWTSEGADDAESDGRDSSIVDGCDRDSAVSTGRAREYLERDLHPLVAHFAMEQLGGVRVKTINHSTSKKSAYGEWVHPDLMGVLFPMTALGDKITVNFGFALQSPQVRLLSFELKRRVDFGNLRACFFQAVSNSSWAHEGYLVAAEWLDDPEFRDELQRLTQAFGIGAIRLDLNTPGNGEIIMPARISDELDWSTLDKLVAMNRDVREFVESVRIDLGARRIHDSEYDSVPCDVSEYARALLIAREP